MNEFCPRPENVGREDRTWIVEERGGRFIEHYMERGQISVVVEGDFEEVLFDVMRSAAQARATRIEVSQRIAGQDTRRQWYGIQRDIMGRMRPDWADRLAEHQAAILAKHPFRKDER